MCIQFQKPSVPSPLTIVSQPIKTVIQPTKSTIKQTTTTTVTTTTTATTTVTTLTTSTMTTTKPKLASVRPVQGISGSNYNFAFVSPPTNISNNTNNNNSKNKNKDMLVGGEAAPVSSPNSAEQSQLLAYIHTLGINENMILILFFSFAMILTKFSGYFTCKKIVLFFKLV